MGNLGGFYSIIQTGSRTVCFVDLNIDCISEMAISLNDNKQWFVD